jgi:hypothetical protein
MPSWSWAGWQHQHPSALFFLGRLYRSLTPQALLTPLFITNSQGKKLGRCHDDFSKLQYPVREETLPTPADAPLFEATLLKNAINLVRSVYEDILGSSDRNQCDQMRRVQSLCAHELLVEGLLLSLPTLGDDTAGLRLDTALFLSKGGIPPFKADGWIDISVEKLYSAETKCRNLDFLVVHTAIREAIFEREQTTLGLDLLILNWQEDRVAERAGVLRLRMETSVVRDFWPWANPRFARFILR